MSNEAPKSSLIGRLFRRGVFVFVYAAVLLLVCEGMVRVFTDTIPPLTIRDEVIGRRYRPGFEARLVNPESEREVDLRFNSLGFRGPEYTIEKPEGTTRIAVLGDSMIAALSVDEHETMVGLLEAQLNERYPERNFEVMNFGVSGSSNWQEYLAYREVVRNFTPDIVLCSFFTGNDLADNSNRLTSNPRIYFDFDESGECVQLPFSSGRAATSRWLNANSRLYVWQKEAKKSLRASSPSGPPSLSPGHLVYDASPDETVLHAWRLVEAALTRLHQAVTDDGAEFLLFLMPGAADIYDDVFAQLDDIAKSENRGFRQTVPNENLQAIATRNEIPYLSLVPAFRAAAPASSVESESEWLFHKGRWHLNERGNEVAAMRILRRIEL